MKNINRILTIIFASMICVSLFFPMRILASERIDNEKNIYEVDVEDIEINEFIYDENILIELSHLSITENGKPVARDRISIDGINRMVEYRAYTLYILVDGEFLSTFNVRIVEPEETVIPDKPDEPDKPGHVDPPSQDEILDVFELETFEIGQKVLMDGREFTITEMKDTSGMGKKLTIENENEKYIVYPEKGVKINAKPNMILPLVGVGTLGAVLIYLWTLLGHKKEVKSFKM